MEAFLCYYDCENCDHFATTSINEPEPEGWASRGGDWFCPNCVEPEQ
jgi:hypothetical protein